jgi:hypothetical protein
VLHDRVYGEFMGRRAGSRRRRLGVVGLALVAGVGLAVGVSPLADTVDVPGDGPWVISVAADWARVEACLEDPRVESALQPAVWPPGPLTLQMREDADRDDVRRVVSCLSGKVGTSQVAVHER